MAMAPSQLGVFTRSDARYATANLEYHVQPLSLESFGGALDAFPAFTASVCNLRPESRGTSRITSTDPATAPSIRPNYLSAEEDRRVAAPGDPELRCQCAALHAVGTGCAWLSAACHEGGNRGMGYRPGHSAASSAADLRGVCAVGSNFAVGRTRPGPGPVDLPAYFTVDRRTDPGALTGGSRQRVQHLCGACKPDTGAFAATSRARQSTRLNSRH